jgi:murein DD-endopeptidase MepM/ murein hydrolase activator NlpD
VVVAGIADECGGLQVRIDHGDGLLSWYRHLSSIETAVGARVAGGAIVGRVGNTGCSLGSHLHFGISRNGTFVDPGGYLPAR